MKKQKEIIEEWKKQGRKWNRLSQRHANSKESHIKTHVTKDEHITGERLCVVEGKLFALEWVLDKDLDFYDKLTQKTGEKEK